MISYCKSLGLERSGRFAEHSGTDSNLVKPLRLLPMLVVTIFQPDYILQKYIGEGLKPNYKHKQTFFKLV
ncbi:hypothetical protein AFK68_01585 [Hydrocoleum sp. CS-953]|nr:hypothetical protein AFK68_01585 [Hydrocoleum sp. CS-953]